MTNSTSESISITMFLPTKFYELIYVLPLLFISILLCFAGTFLTLDRTRFFPPTYDNIPESFNPKSVKKACFFRLEGGVGGLAAGYAFGVHCSTFLSLLIPGVSSSPPPGPKAFAAIWLLSISLVVPLAGRWKYAALAFMGTTGGAVLGIALGIIIHPSMPFRVVLPVIFAPLLTIFALIPHPRTQHVALRITSSHVGAFGIVVAIAILTKNLAWEDAWVRLWVKERADWGSGKEKGLSTAFCFLTTFGGLFDWVLRRKFGECPDERWDAYLSEYSNSLPNLPDRTGTFRPLASFWDRLFRSRDTAFVANTLSDGMHGYENHSHTLSKDPLLSPFSDESISVPDGIPLLETGFTTKLQKPTKLVKRRSPSYAPTPAFLRKSRSRAKSGTRTPRRTAVKFQAGIDEYSSDESDITFLPPKPPPNLRYASSSGQTRFENQSLSSSTTKGANDDPRATTQTGPPSSEHWVPDFIKRGKIEDEQSKNTKDVSMELLSAVPATPSLINALDRVAAAQQDAFKHTRPARQPIHSSPAKTDPESRYARLVDIPTKGVETDGFPSRMVDQSKDAKALKDWDGFWKDVLVKAKY